MRIRKIWMVIIIVALVLIIALVGTDALIKLGFSGNSYSNVSYRIPPTDFHGFFKSIKYEDDMTIEMMEVFFDKNSHINGIDMNFSKQKDESNFSRYKSSYNMKGAGLSQLYYTGFFEYENINDKDRPSHQIWKSATPKILKALSSFPTDKLFSVFPKAVMYNIGIRNVLNIKNNKYKNEWITSNTYLVENDSIHKITSEDNFYGDYAIFELKLDKPKEIERQINDLINSNPIDEYIIYLSLNS